MRPVPSIATTLGTIILHYSTGSNVAFPARLVCEDRDQVHLIHQCIPGAPRLPTVLTKELLN